MRFVIFTHSLVSDWNHGNAHFLRGIATELVARGHEVRIFEPRDGWSRSNLLNEYGDGALADFERAYPQIRSSDYDPESLDLAAALEGADVVIVHEWNDRERGSSASANIERGTGRFVCFPRHPPSQRHRSGSMAAYDLRHYDGVLAYGNAIRDIYRERRWAAQAWTWHEAADTRIFYPRIEPAKQGDVVWIGNWGDEERSEELREFLIDPVRELRLKARVYGVRYPATCVG